MTRSAPHAEIADAARCPLCGATNACELEAARHEGRAPGVCWCMEAQVPAALLARVPPAARGRRCICAACVEAAVQSGAGAGTWRMNAPR